MLRSLLKKSIFIIITFIGISFICSIIFTMTASIVESIDENNGFLTEKSLELNFENVKDLTKEDLQQLKKIDENMLLYKEDSQQVIRGVYCSGNKVPNVKMIQGRYFKEEDFKIDKKLAVVGKNKVKECMNKDGKMYYIDDNDRYEVIGVMGYEDKYTMLDNWIHFNMSGVYSHKEDWSSNGIYSIECGERTKESSDKIKKYIENKFHGSKVEISPNKTVSSQVDSLFMGMLRSSGTAILLILCIALNTVSLTSEWIDNRKKELAIKKAFGATDERIAKVVKLEYVTLITLSFLVGFILSIIALKLGVLGDLGKGIYYVATIVAYLICLLIGIITVRIPIKKAKEVEVSEIMK